MVYNNNKHFPALQTSDNQSMKHIVLNYNSLR